MSLVEQFLEFIEQVPTPSVQVLSDRVLRKCRELTGAEAGTIFIVRRHGPHRLLEALSVHNDSVSARPKAFVVPINETSISGYVATIGETVFIDDAYAIPEDKPYQFNRSFDDRTGFRTRSILCFPLRNFQHKIIGVVQLINRRTDGAGPPVPFPHDDERMIAPVNHIIGRALERADSLDQIAAKNRKLRERNRQLQVERERVEKLQAETERAFMLSVELLARAAELHDADTGNHILRVNQYSRVMAQWAGMNKAFCEEISHVAALHDVGKMSVDKAILHKKGRLSSEEFAEMQRHTTYGYEILRNSDRLAMAADIAHCHHEKWDGTGYPSRLTGDQIPISARIVAVADIYDALRSARPYKPGFSHERSVEIMLKGDDRIDPASHFDPRMIRLFAEHHERFAAIWDALSDDPTAEIPEEAPAAGG